MLPLCSIEICSGGAQTKDRSLLRQRRRRTTPTFAPNHNPPARRLPSMSSHLSTPAELKQALDQFDTILLDCDGVSLIRPACRRRLR